MSDQDTTKLAAALPPAELANGVEPELGARLIASGERAYLVLEVKPIKLARDLGDGDQAVTLGIMAIEEVDNVTGRDLIETRRERRTGVAVLPGLSLTGDNEPDGAA